MRRQRRRSAGARPHWQPPIRLAGHISRLSAARMCIRGGGTVTASEAAAPVSYQRLADRRRVRVPLTGRRSTRGDGGVAWAGVDGFRGVRRSAGGHLRRLRSLSGRRRVSGRGDRQRRSWLVARRPGPCRSRAAVARPGTHLSGSAGFRPDAARCRRAHRPPHGRETSAGEAEPDTAVTAILLVETCVRRPSAYSPPPLTGHVLTARDAISRTSWPACSPRRPPIWAVLNSCWRAAPMCGAGGGHPTR